jgi:hypothetical protein
MAEEVYVVEYVEQSMKQKPKTKELIIFKTKEEAIKYYQDHKRAQGWPWRFFSYPIVMEKTAAELKSKELKKVI